MIDFDEADFETSFELAPNPKQEEDFETSFELGSNPKQEEKKESKIKIDITDVEELISELSYTAKEFEKSADKLFAKQELGKILQLLEKIESDDLKRLEDVFKNLDIQFIENIIRKNIENTTKQVDDILSINLNKIKKETKKVSETYKQYAEVLSDADSIEALDNIQKIEKFTKSFKFRSSVIAAIATAAITAVVTATVIYTSMEQYNNMKIQQELRSYGAAAKVLKDKEVVVYQDKTAAQLIFSKDVKVQCFNADDGRRVVQFEK